MIIGIFEDTCDAEGEGDSAWDAKLQGAHRALCTMHCTGGTAHCTGCTVHCKMCSAHGASLLFRNLQQMLKIVTLLTLLIMMRRSTNTDESIYCLLCRLWHQ